VLEVPGDGVIGCVYLYPPRGDGHDVDVRSWMRADRAQLDIPLYEAVSEWLTRWPFTGIDYAWRAASPNRLRRATGWVNVELPIITR
jgi:hypothetical protein